MKFSISREDLLKPLQQVSGVVERKQTLPILANVLLSVSDNQLTITGTDMELELVAKVSLEGNPQPGELTVPARKFFDICKSLPANAEINISQQEQKLIIKSSRSRFSLVTLPAADFPNLEETASILEFQVQPAKLINIINQTAFSMAQQDVRYYLNGMLIEVCQGNIRSVSTDGHRLAMCDAEADIAGVEVLQIILPRKGVLEISRLLADIEDEATIFVGSNHFRISTMGFIFTSKLVDGKFPDYKRVLPQRSEHCILVDREELKMALSRVAILSNEKYRGIRCVIDNEQLQITANNPEQEEAEEVVNIEYQGKPLEVGFNVSYLLDVLNAIKEEQVLIDISDSNSSAIIYGQDNSKALYVVMPMRL